MTRLPYSRDVAALAASAALLVPATANASGGSSQGLPTLLALLSVPVLLVALVVLVVFLVLEKAQTIVGVLGVVAAGLCAVWQVIWYGLELMAGPFPTGFAAFTGALDVTVFLLAGLLMQRKRAAPG